MNREAYEAVIGLEVHTHLLTRSKLFCGCSTTFGAGPNENVCPVCMGMPGVLPVMNRRVVELAIRTGLAAHCAIAPYSIFDRKSYFYPDLPKGYQISQYETPICKGGYIDLPATENGEPRRIGLTRIHIEEDAGKNIHGENASLVDFNRSGVPLIEIVSEPDLRSAEDAGAYLRQLRAILRYVDASDGKMEEGSFRCDCNVSIRKRGAKEYGVRTEIKNLNSFRFVEDAIDYEVGRQIAIVESGGKVAQETHLWDPARKETRPMRSKEYANDYRYFPEPDLPPLIVSPEFLAQTRKKLPELPETRRARMIAEYELAPKDAFTLTATREFADRFETAAKTARNPRRVANLLLSELGGRLKALGLELENSPVSMAGVVLAADLLDENKISSRQLKQLFDVCFEKGEDFAAVYQREKPEQLTDSSAIEAMIDQVIAANPRQVEQYRAGKKTLAGFFVGQVMKDSKGQANPALLNELVTKKLEG
jgi:aspartyl-tRNA(Asn)/glutamyl-tRNA(Gln) amidotransferase subunit B